MLLYEPIKYEIFEESLSSSELGAYRAFGIRGVNLSGESVIVCSDVSADETFTRTLCEACNALQVSPLHILDIIEDSL